MTTFLLDVNVLIALIDPVHVEHDAAHQWFEKTGSTAWATCPVTENGVLRIVGNARYPNSPGTPGAVARSMSRLRGLPGHSFWPDSISLLETDGIDAHRLLNSNQVTDSYLLALAKQNGGKLATFDRRLVTSAIHDGGTALHVIR